MIEAIELHSVAGIRRALAAGVSPTTPIDGKTPVEILIEMYTRSANFVPCLKTLLDAGATINDPLLRAVLLDDPTQLPADISPRLNPLCAFTSCRGVTALHLCAEFNSTRCAQALLSQGADIDARAAIDAQGLGGQTPLFHCVNSNLNFCRPMFDLLLDAGADVTIRVDALLWGESMDWETVIFDVTPISYAQCGLYRQFHRDEKDVYSAIDAMYRQRHQHPAPIRNVPNRYLQT
jgi:ankyrin repeat protein